MNPTPRPPATPARDGNGGVLERAGQMVRDAWNDQPVTVRDLSDGSIEVGFPDARAVYDRNGGKLRGDANAPGRRTSRPSPSRDGIPAASSASRVCR